MSAATTTLESLRAISRKLTSAFRTDAGILVLIWALLSWHWLLGFKLLPWDAFDEFYPVAYFVAQTVRSGQLPWWNPYQYSGTPLFADPQSLLFTAFTLVGAILGKAFSPTVFNWVCLAHVLAGGLGLLAYLRRFETTRLRRLVAVCVYMFAGVATSRLQHVPQIVTYGYLPIVLWLAMRAVDRPTLRRGLPVVVVVALICCNPNQLTLLGGIAVAGVVALHLSELPLKAAIRGSLLVLSMCLVALIVSAPVLTAVTEFAALSNRPAFTVDDSAAASLPPFALLALGFPGVFGTGGLVGAHWTPNDITENWLYIGVPALLLLVAGVPSMRSRSHVGIGAALVFFGWFSLGTHASLYPWLFTHIPGFNLFRRPSDAAYVLMFLLAILLARQRGTDAWLGARKAMMIAAIPPAIAISGVLGLGVVKWIESRDAFRLFLVASAYASIRYIVLATFVLYLLSRIRTDATTGHRSVTALVIVAALDMVAPVRFGEFAGASRSWDVGRYYRYKLDRPGTQEVAKLMQWLRLNDTVGERAQFRIEASVGPLASGFPNFASLASTQGYAPIRLGSYQSRIGAVAGSAPQSFAGMAKGYDSAWFRAIGLKYVLIPAALLKSDGDVGELGRRTSLARDSAERAGVAEHFTAAGYKIWKLPNPFPPVRLISADRLPDKEPSEGESALGSCKFLGRTASSFSASCLVERPSIAALTEIAHPGWFACVDGRIADLNTAWGAFRAVPLPSGVHQIDLYFEPSPLLRWRRCPEPAR